MKKILFLLLLLPAFAYSQCPCTDTQLRQRIKAVYRDANPTPPKEAGLLDSLVKSKVSVFSIAIPVNKFVIGTGSGITGTNFSVNSNGLVIFNNDAPTLRDPSNFINSTYVFAERTKLISSGGGTITDAFVVGDQHQLGDSTNYYSGTAGFTYGVNNNNFAGGALVGGVGAQVNYGANGPSSGGVAISFDGNGDRTFVYPYVTAAAAAFNVSHVTSGYTSGHGALGLYSFILGGYDNDIPSDCANCGILGGHNIIARSGDPNQIYVPNFNIDSTPLSDNALTDFLVRDPITGQIKKRSASSLITGTVASAQQVAYGSGSNTLTSSSNFQFDGNNVSISGFVGANEFGANQNLRAGGNSTAAGYLDLFEDTDFGTNRVRIQVPSLGSNYDLTLPTTLGSGGVISVDGSGNMSVTTSSGITNTAIANELGMSDGTNIVPSGLFGAANGNLTFGSSSISGSNRTLAVAGSASNIDMNFTSKGTGGFNFTSNGLTGVIKGVGSAFTISSGSNIQLDNTAGGVTTVSSSASGGDVLISAVDQITIQSTGTTSIKTNPSASVSPSAGMTIGTGNNSSTGGSGSLTISTGTTVSGTQGSLNIQRGSDSFSLSGTAASINTGGTHDINLTSGKSVTITANGSGETANITGDNGVFFADNAITNIISLTPSAIGITSTVGNIDISTADFAGSVSISDGVGGQMIFQGSGNPILVTGTDLTIENVGVVSGWSLAPSLDFGSQASLGSGTLTVTVSGASAGDKCIISPRTSTGAIFTCYVTGTGSNNVTLVYHNTTSATLDPVPATYDILVLHRN